MSNNQENNPPLRDYQQAAVDALNNYWTKSDRPCIMQLATGCHAKGHPILMGDGTMKHVEDIEVGDYVMSPNGPVKVINLHRGRERMFRVMARMGASRCNSVAQDSFVVNEHHLLHLSMVTARYRADRSSTLNRQMELKGVNKLFEYRDITVGDIWRERMVAKKSRGKRSYDLYVGGQRLVYSGYDDPMDPVEPPFDPYFLGVYASAGSRAMPAPVSPRTILPQARTQGELCEEYGLPPDSRVPATLSPTIHSIAPVVLGKVSEILEKHGMCKLTQVSANSWIIVAADGIRKNEYSCDTNLTRQVGNRTISVKCSWIRKMLTDAGVLRWVFDENGAPLDVNVCLPYDFMRWSRKNRELLMAGFLDGAGGAHVPPGSSGVVRTSLICYQKSFTATAEASMLGRSLGLKCGVIGTSGDVLRAHGHDANAYINKADVGRDSAKRYKNRQYHITFVMNEDFFKLPLVYRNDGTRLILRSDLGKIPKHEPKVRIFEVEPLGEGDYYGFEVDSTDHLYIDGLGIVHHNSGKSHIIADVASKSDRPVLVLQPSKEILEQNVEKLLNTGFSKQKVSVCSASAGSWMINRYVTFATIGTIAKHVDKCQHVGTVLIDEVDCVPTDRADSQYMKFLNGLPKGTRIVGISATPWRNVVFSQRFQDPKVFCRPMTRIHCQGGKGTNLGEWVWNKVIYRCGIKDLQTRGFLSPTKYYVAETDWSFVRDVPGRVDYDTGQMMKWIDIEANTSRFTQAVKWCMDNHLKTIVFTPNIDMNFRLQNVITSLGGTAETMDSDHDDKRTREAKMQAFRDGKFQFLVNVGMVGRGVDVPSVDCVVLARPTKSLGLYLQMIGRCLRIDPNNPTKIAYVIDLAGNVKRFGEVENVELVALDSTTDSGWKFKKETILIHRPGKSSPEIFDRVS